jgi:hypothetical protein
MCKGLNSREATTNGWIKIFAGYDRRKIPLDEFVRTASSPNAGLISPRKALAE